MENCEVIIDLLTRQTWLKEHSFPQYRKAKSSIVHVSLNKRGQCEGFDIAV